MIKQAHMAVAMIAFGAALALSRPAAATEPSYGCSSAPLEVRFAIAGGRYNGAVNCGNLFMQSDIPTAPVVRWQRARAGKFYTLIMVDFDGNAHGSWPDQVAPGENAPVRHWIVGNIPGDVLRRAGYREAAPNAGANILQPYRDPHIPVVSDRYAVYLFQQAKRLQFAAVPDPITNFPLAAFLDRYHLAKPEASNFFVVIYTSESPFSGKAFHGNDVSGTWHQDLGKGKLLPTVE
jgi:hypothetical protein